MQAPNLHYPQHDRSTQFGSVPYIAETAAAAPILLYFPPAVVVYVAVGHGVGDDTGGVDTVAVVPLPAPFVVYVLYFVFHLTCSKPAAVPLVHPLIARMMKRMMLFQRPLLKDFVFNISPSLAFSCLLYLKNKVNKANKVMCVHE